jgi:glycosyltransferase involved in cell wall biosynthesis
MNKKRVLIVSFYYPPISSIASNRIYSFVKYLNKDIFDIDVVTVKSKEAIDYKIFDNVSIYRISKNPLDYYLDSSSKNIFIRKLKALYNILIKNIFFKLWQVKSIKVILKLNKQKNYDIILSSYAPKESHLIALKIKSKYTNIKWIADMRDEMSLNPFISAKEKKSLQIIEQNIFKHCDAITTVSKPILDDFKKLSNNTKNILFREIRNGYAKIHILCLINLL